MIFPRQRAIAVDVDGTLVRGGNLNEPLVAWLTERKAEGFALTLWSAGGKDHALAVARAFHVEQLFDSIISKPGYIVDDEGWTWTRFTRCIYDFTEPPP